jgi:hypothetical protein
MRCPAGLGLSDSVALIVWQLLLLFRVTGQYTQSFAGVKLACLDLWQYTYFNVKSTIFWDIPPCSPLKVNQNFGGIYRLHHQVRISRVRYSYQSETGRSAWYLVSRSSFACCLLHGCFLLTYFSTVKMEATRFSETSVVFQRYIQVARTIRSSSRTVSKWWNKTDAEEWSRGLFKALSRVISWESEERNENPVRSDGVSGEIRAGRLTIMSLKRYRYISSLN